MEQNEDLDYNQLCVQYKDLVEAMAYVALQRMKKPSPHTFEDLRQEGYIVCVEWVKRWFHPERGASLKTFITAGLRNHFADLVHASFKEVGSSLSIEGIGTSGVDEEPFTYQIESDQIDLDPIEMVSFKETVRRLSEEELKYITLILTPINVGEKRKMPTRADVRRILNLSEEEENQIRNSIREKLVSQVAEG